MMRNRIQGIRPEDVSVKKQDGGEMNGIPALFLLDGEKEIVILCDAARSQGIDDGDVIIRYTSDKRQDFFLVRDRGYTRAFEIGPTDSFPEHYAIKYDRLNADQYAALLNQKKQVPTTDRTLLRSNVIIPFQTAKPQIRQQIDQGEILLARLGRPPIHLEEFRDDFASWNKYNLIILSVWFDNDQYQNAYREALRNPPYLIVQHGSEPFQETQFSRAALKHCLRILQSVQRDLTLDEAQQGALTKAMVVTSEEEEIVSVLDPRKVFVIHGRNVRLNDALFIFLQAIGLHPYVSI